jgi:hypothetical protein
VEIAIFLILLARAIIATSYSPNDKKILPPF